MIDCIGTRLREIDPKRWETVPITFKTSFIGDEGFIDFRTIINVHDAVEREFGIDIKDRAILLTDVETAWGIVEHHHDAL